MVDRHLIGDVALAVLLSIPVAALARPGFADQPQTKSASANYHDTGDIAAKDRPVSLLR